MQRNSSSEELEHLPLTGACIARQDDAGIWNFCKAWYLFVLHIAASITLAVITTILDNNAFQVGSAPNGLFPYYPLYQTQVTALVALGVLLVRLISGIATNLLLWRVIFVLLDRRGMQLGELADMVVWRWPVLPTRKAPAFWSFWALLAMLLLWPSNLASPLVNSSISWIPDSRVLNTLQHIKIAGITNQTNWNGLLYPDECMYVVASATSMLSKGPGYAYINDYQPDAKNNSKLPLRRYFASRQPEPITDGSKMSLHMPYFAMKLKWIDANTTFASKNAMVRNSSYIDVTSDIEIRTFGTTTFVRDKVWDAAKAIPTERGILKDQRVLGIKLHTINIGSDMGHGTIANLSTACPTMQPIFGKVPNVTQLQIPLYTGNKITSYECYMFAHAEIVAGSYNASRCNVSTTSGINQSYATCHIKRDDHLVNRDWLTHLAFDFTSQTVKYGTLLNYTQPQINMSLDDYVTGTMTSGFHAAWSALMLKYGDPTAEPVTFRPSETIVRASVDRSRLYIWLGLQCCLLGAGILVCIAGRFSKVKTIRDPTLAVLTMDLHAVTHDVRARGLCSAVALTGDDRRLPLMRWAGSTLKDDIDLGRGDDSERICRRQVVFADSD